MPPAPVPAARGPAAVPQPRWRRPAERAAPAPVDAPAPAEAVDTYDLSFYVFCVYTFILMARPQDYIAALVPLRLALVFTGLTFLVTVLRSDGLELGRVWRRETKLYIVFYAAMCAGIPFAVHRGRTFDVAVTGYIVNVLYFLLFLVQVNSWARFRRVLLVVMASALLFCYFETILGDFRSGRYVRRGSQMYDPNDVAFVGITFLPFLIGVALGRFTALVRLTASVGALFLVLLNLYTGSRGGFLGLVVLFALFLFLRMPQVGKPHKLAMTVVLLAGALANIDKIDVERYRSIGQLEEDYNMSDEWGRKEIWTRGLILFAQNPLTGVGAENFSEAIGTMRQAEGLIPKWQPSHNSFVQVLAETGVFGAGAYLLLIAACLRTLNRLRRQGSATQVDVGVLPGILLVGFVAQLVSAFFLTFGYSILLTLSFAVATSLGAIAGGPRETRRA